MGFFRTLLAIAVIASHTEPLFGMLLPNGIVAVQCFYMVSGFYMALILSSSYEGRIKQFYMARALRIFPQYWIVLAIALVLTFWGGFGGPLPEVSGLPFISQAMIYIANITLIGLDWFHFLTFDDSGLPIWGPDAGAEKYSRYIAVNQMWTLGVEITFYALAPFLIRLSSLKLAAICLVSLSARYVGYQHGLLGEPWAYRFFPFELAFFMFGVLAYRAYQHVISPYYGEKARYGNLLMYFSGAVFLSLLLMSLGMEYLIVNVPKAHMVYYASVFVAMPFVFAFTRNIKLDGLVGQLSYPLYVVHFTFILYCPDLMKSGVLPYGVSVVLASIIAAIALIVVTQPIENYRGRFRKQVGAGAVNE